jgi:hypothetical protein
MTGKHRSWSRSTICRRRTIGNECAGRRKQVFNIRKFSKCLRTVPFRCWQICRPSLCVSLKDSKPSASVRHVRDGAVRRSGPPLSKERLSEGEKQIFAISVLWGLARASAHPLPAIIDTPMARLDAAHRRHLVERYFPHASHQVLILSTDTEVDRQYYHALEPHIARAYHLNYDEQTRATHGEEGYFWEQSPTDNRSGNQA